MRGCLFSQTQRERVELLDSRRTLRCSGRLARG